MELKRDFPKIKFSSNKQSREENVSAINKDHYLEASKLLCEQKQFDDALLINIMGSFASRPSEILTLRFEDFEDTAKITSFLKCFVSCFSCLVQGSAVSLPYH